MRAQFEDVHWTGQESYLLRRFDLPQFEVPWHFHPEIELTLILEGSGDRCVGDHLESFEAGDLVLLGGNLPHYWHSHAPGKVAAQEERPKARASAIVLHLRVGMLPDMVLALPEAANWRALVDQARRGLAFSGIFAERASLELSRLHAFSGSAQLLALLSILETLVEGLPQSRPLASEHYLPACDDHAAARIRRVYQYLYAHLAEPIGLDDLARVAGMSSAAFCRYCRRVTGRTPTRLLAELRITQACKLLTDTDQSVSEIGFAAGFQSISNFNRVFQQMKSTSPLSYRRAHARLG